MRAAEATALAQEWVRRNHNSIEGYRGAYLAGSICWMEPNDELSPFSDIDIHLVVNDDQLEAKPGKFRFEGALLEVSADPFSLFELPESTVSNAPVAASVARNKLIDDPDGVLRPAFDTIAAEFPRRHRVVERLNGLDSRIRGAMSGVNDSAAFHDQMMWMLPATLTTHVVLSAGLGNPTVRRRFVEAGAILHRYGESDLLDVLLGLVGCDQITSVQAQKHLDALTPIYDATSAIKDSTSRWVSDVSADARTISIDGTQDLIDRGYHRESMLWIVVTFTRCLNVISASSDRSLFADADKAFRRVTADIGIETAAAIRDQSAAIIAALPGIRSVADRILERNPDIVRD